MGDITSDPIGGSPKASTTGSTLPPRSHSPERSPRTQSLTSESAAAPAQREDKIRRKVPPQKLTPVQRRRQEAREREQCAGQCEGRHSPGGGGGGTETELGGGDPDELTTTGRSTPANLPGSHSVDLQGESEQPEQPEKRRRNPRHNSNIERLKTKASEVANGSPGLSRVELRRRQAREKLLE